MISFLPVFLLKKRMFLHTIVNHSHILISMHGFLHCMNWSTCIVTMIYIVIMILDINHDCKILIWHLFLAFLFVFVWSRNFFLKYCATFHRNTTFCSRALQKHARVTCDENLQTRKSRRGFISFIMVFSISVPNIWYSKYIFRYFT